MARSFCIVLLASFLAVACGLFLFAEAAIAEEGGTNHNPVVCTGYLGYQKNAFGSPLAGICPPNFVVVGANITQRVRRGASPEEVPVNPSCCELPAKDILTDSHTMELVECPDGYIATGGEYLLDITLDREVPYHVRCTKINTKRYQLGEKSPGVYYGIGMPFWKQDYVIMRRDIPPGIREGIGRKDKYSWYNHGCVGNPAGSVLVKKSNKRCHGYFFSELQYAGMEGDPPRGSKVKMFPDCRSVEGVFRSDPLCLQ